MNVERVRSVEIDPTETPRERSGAKGSGFSDLMDSVLGPAVEKQKAGRESAETQQKTAPHGRPLRVDPSETRSPGRAGDAQAEETPAEESSVASELVREEITRLETGPKRSREQDP